MSEAQAAITATADTGVSEAPEMNEGNDSSDNASANGGQQAKADAKANAKAIRELGDADMDALVTIKVDGQAQKMPLREAIKLQQLEQVSRKRMTEAEQMKGQLKGLFQQAKSNPQLRDRLMAEMGITNKVEFAEMTLTEQLQRLSETPEQRQAREDREWRQEHEKRIKAEQEENEKKQNDERETKAQQAYNQEFVKAWQSSGLPAHRRFGQLMAAEMLSATRQGQPLSWDAAAVKVKESFNRDVKGIFEDLDATAIRTLLGDKILKKLRDADAKLVRGAPTVNSGTRSDKSVPKSKGQGKPAKSEAEYRAWIESLKG